LTNHYEILGLPVSAGIGDIKSAFRRLAKQYHPDKNPNGKEYFEKILRAYETLSDPVQKSSYDYKLNYHLNRPQGAQQPKPGNGKTWKFDDKEMKRRQYYNDHIKKYAKETATYNAEAKTKKHYNEYKYMLFATPIAVALFVLIMKVAGPAAPSAGNSSNNFNKAPEEKIRSLQPGDAPYNSYFGKQVYDTISEKKITIRNLTGADVIVALFTKGIFTRGFYIQSSYSAEVSQLPPDPLEIRYSSGINFDYTKKMPHADIFGVFAKDQAFFKTEAPVVLGNVNVLTLMPGLNEGFKKISDSEYFNKNTDDKKS
jgi:curved DNA-binding protein CbpA